jgi:hypothetical protein
MTLYTGIASEETDEDLCAWRADSGRQHPLGDDAVPGQEYCPIHLAKVLALEAYEANRANGVSS